MEELQRRHVVVTDVPPALPNANVVRAQVQPQLLNSLKKRKRVDSDEEEEKERFLISATGRPIYNASNDLNRLHSK